MNEQSMEPIEIDRLLREKDKALEEYNELDVPAKAAWKRYEKAAAAYKDAVLYEKARRKVIRELLAAAKAQGDEEP